MIPSQEDKKPPACDYCKAKRAICHPQPDGSCPRCLEKGLICTTTLVARRKRRTNAEIKRDQDASPRVGTSGTTFRKRRTRAETERSANTSRSSFTGSSPGSDFQRIMYPSPDTPDTRFLVTPGLDLSSSFVEQLFVADFRNVPQFFHPIVSPHELKSSLKRCKWQLQALPSSQRVLVQCIIAVTARISTNKLIVGLDSGYHDLNLAIPVKGSMDLQELGRRRETVCEQLRAEALRLAHQEGVTSRASRTNAACCTFLDFLEYRASGQGGGPYAAAYFRHLRDIAEGTDDLYDHTHDVITRTKYSAFHMGDALAAVTTGKTVLFTHHDELLVCGDEPTPLEYILETLLSDSPEPTPISAFMHPTTVHVIRIARESAERLTGAFARRNPLDEFALTCHLNSLDLLHSVIFAGYGQVPRLQNRLSTISFFFARLSLYPLLLAWGSLVLALCDEMKRRRDHNRAYGMTASVGVGSAQTRLDLYYLQIRATACQAALEIADSLEEVPAISRVTHMKFGDMRKWANFLLEDVESGDISHEQRVWALERFRDSLHIQGFSWVDRTGVVGAINEFLASTAQDQNAAGRVPAAGPAVNLRVQCPPEYETTDDFLDLVEQFDTWLAPVM